METFTSVNIDPYEILDELSTEQILGYLKDTGYDPENLEERDIVENFFHGDFDLKKLLKSIGKDAVTKVLREYIREENIVI